MRTSPCLPALAALAALAGIALGGCGRDKAPPPPASGSGSASAAPAGVELFLNDLSIGTIQPAQVANWSRLDALVPGDARKLGTWELVSLQGKKPRPAELAHPSASYPDMVPAVFPGDGGAAAFGMFDAVELAKRGKPAMHEDHLTAIRIKVTQGGNRGQNDDGGGGGGTHDPTKLVITVKTPAGTTTITGNKLLGIPRSPAPDNPDHKGWRLQALLDAAGVKTYDHLVLTSADGTSLPLDKKDLSATSVPFIKLNKAGILRLRVMKKTGDGWNPAGDVRGLTGIEVK
ncbi:MAG TPA: hypothetical protein VF469_37735 [Kofleriaceae bacterium]